MNHREVVHILKEVMAVFEMRYLKTIPLGLAVAKYVGAVAQTEIPLSGH